MCQSERILGKKNRMNRLDKIKVEGFKSISSTVLDIKPINVLIGGNGSGKSNFIEAFTLLRKIAEGNLVRYVKINDGADRLLHFGTKSTREIRLHVFFNSDVSQYEISLEPTPSNGLVPVDEYAYFWNKEKYEEPYEQGFESSGGEAGISQSDTRRVTKHVKLALKSWRVYHFHDTGFSSPLKKLSNIDDNRFLRGDGSNLASFLYRLKELHIVEYKLIRNTMRRIAPFFLDFVLEPRALGRETIRLEWKHKESDSYFDVSSLSDGSLRFLALATLLLQPKELKPSIILMDEPELGLHPSAISVLGAMIRSASKEVQLLISTQSPILLDQFEPDQVIVVEQQNGRSEFFRLESDQLKGWLSEYSLGELWEKNELGGRPK